MEQTITLQSGIKYIVSAVAVLLFVLIFPLGVIQHSEVSKSDEVILQESEPISVANNGTQMFIAEGSYLKSVKLYVANDMSGETITFRVYDGAYKQLWETFHIVDADAQFPGWIHILVDMEMEEGWEYYYTVEGLTTDLVMYYEDTYSSASFANGTYLYGGEEQPGINLIVRYQYTENFPWWLVTFFGIMIFGTAFVLQKGIDRWFQSRGSHWNPVLTIRQFLQWTLNPVVALVTAAALLAVFPGRWFGVGKINYAFYGLGILITAAVVFWAINGKRPGTGGVIQRKKLEKRLPAWLMSVCFAGMLWSCSEYMNGLYTIHHQYATCKLIIWMGLALICTFPKRNVLHIWSVIYVVLASIGGYLYAKPYVGIVEKEELYRLQSYVLVVGGYVMIQLIFSAIQIIIKRWVLKSGWNLPYVLLFGAWWFLFLLFRNTRDWVVLMAVLFAVFYYCMWIWDKRSSLLWIFSNGIILNFIYTVGYCLLHRPYLRFRHNRYGMIYHTVTMTGYYLALVLCAVVVRFLIQYRKTGSYKACWKELVLVGVGNVYLFLTLSRTGYLAAFVMQVFMIVFSSLVWERKKCRTILCQLGLFAAVSVTAFPAVFTAQRILPAWSNDPIYSEIEIWDYVVEKNDPMDSELYIDIQAFIKVAGNKLFGKDMGNLSLSDASGELQWGEWHKYTRPVYRMGEGRLYASEAEQYEEEDISNGRFDIFAEYIAQWNLTGHETMGVTMPDGSVPTHAHNTFLQMIHDHGILTGILFVLVGVSALIYTVAGYVRGRKESSYLLLTIAVLIAFSAAGMVEWIFHLCNPFGCSLMVVVTPLLFKKTGAVKK